MERTDTGDPEAEQPWPLANIRVLPPTAGPLERGAYTIALGRGATTVELVTTRERR